MQLKLLNFYKFLSNFANNLVGSFVPLIIYVQTGKLYIAFLYLVCQQAIRLATSYFLRNQMRNNPQMFLLFRIVTLTLYNVFILLIDVNLWVGVVGVCVFLAIDTSFKYSANEYIYNYSSLNKSSKSLGLTRVFEEFGLIASLLIGGYLLDVNTVVVIIISLGLYFISLIPLLIYYFRSRKEKSFNKDATSNAFETLSKDIHYGKYGKKIIYKILLSYFVVYFIFCSYDIFKTTFTLELFANGSSKYALAGIIGAVFEATYGVGSYIAGKLIDKYDTTWLARVACVVMGLCVLSFTFVQSNISLYMLFAIIGLVYPFLSLFVLQRMLVKSRILGVSNSAICNRECACDASYLVYFGLALLFSLFPKVVFFPVYIAIAVSLFISAWLVPENEEKTRKLLVDFLEDNEILNEEKVVEEKEKTSDK